MRINISRISVMIISDMIITSFYILAMCSATTKTCYRVVVSEGVMPA